MSFTAAYTVPTQGWQDWESGKVAFAADKGKFVPLAERDARRQDAYNYLHQWDMETDESWLAYQSCVVSRSDMVEVGQVDRSKCYDRMSTGIATRYELAEAPGNALTLFFCDLGDGTTEVWFDTYGA